MKINPLTAAIRAALESWRMEAWMRRELAALRERVAS
jgi:hypothetical protein